MHRKNFLDLMRCYYPSATPEERPVVDELTAFVRKTPGCFDRVAGEGARHITGSVMLVSHSMEKTLMHYHKKLGRWLQFGGHADGNPDITAVALAELAEETGVTNVSIYRNIPFDIDRFMFDDPAVFGYRKTIYDVRFLAIAAADEVAEIREPEKTGELRWATPDEARELAGNNESMVRLIDKWQAMAGYYKRFAA